MCAFLFANADQENCKCNVKIKRITINYLGLHKNFTSSNALFVLLIWEIFIFPFHGWYIAIKKLENTCQYEGGTYHHFEDKSTFFD